MNTALRMSEVRASIERLFATGRYADIQVDAAALSRRRAPSCSSPRTVGSSATLARRATSPARPTPGNWRTRRSSTWDSRSPTQKLQAGIDNQKRLLETNGLFQGQVHPVFDWETDKDYQQVNIRFEIDSRPACALRHTCAQRATSKWTRSGSSRATKFRRWLIHTWKPMTQTRVRQGLEACARSTRRTTAWRPRSRSNRCSTTPRPIAPSPRCSIDAGPRIEVRTVGAKLSRKTLRRYIPVFEEHAVDHDLLVEGARNLRDYFQSQGYFDAEVEFKEQRVINDKAAIDYLINTGTRHKLVAIEINGNHYFNTETLRERMYLQPATLPAVPPRALQRRPAAPRRELHPQPVRIERIPRRSK